MVLERLAELRWLWLNDNDVVDPLPVLRMAWLIELNLAGNPLLQCPTTQEIPHQLILTLPDHCEK